MPQPLTSAQQALAGSPSALGMARAMARRKARSCPWFREQLESAAFVALVESASRWRPRCGTAFLSYAYARIRGALVDELRSCAPHGYRRSKRSAPSLAQLSAITVRYPNGEAEPLADAIPDQDLPVGWEVDSEDVVRAILAKLHPRRRRILELYFLHAKTALMRQVARRLRCSHSWISLEIKAALAHLSKITLEESR